MDIGKVIEIGERAIPGYEPSPTMIPVVPEHDDPVPERAPESEPERVDA